MGKILDAMVNIANVANVADVSKVAKILAANRVYRG